MSSAAKDDECSICLAPLYSSQQLCTIQCGHVFDHTCLTKWLITHQSCPFCRAKTSKNDVIKLYFRGGNDELSEEVESLKKKLDLKKFEVEIWKESAQRALDEVKRLNGEVKQMCGGKSVAQSRVSTRQMAKRGSSMVD